MDSKADLSRNRNFREGYLAGIGAACMISAFLQWALYAKHVGEQPCLCKDYEGTGSICILAERDGCCRTAFYKNFLRHKE
jgi:hypothetical protein